MRCGQAFRVPVSRLRAITGDSGDRGDSLPLCPSPFHPNSSQHHPNPSQHRGPRRARIWLVGVEGHPDWDIPIDPDLIPIIPTTSFRGAGKLFVSRFPDYERLRAIPAIAAIHLPLPPPHFIKVHQESSRPHQDPIKAAIKAPSTTIDQICPKEWRPSFSLFRITRSPDHPIPRGPTRGQLALQSTLIANIP